MAAVDAMDRLIADLNRKFSPPGAQKQVITRADGFDPVRVIPCASYALGYLMGSGGWFEGKLHEFFGPEHAGKTTLMLMALMDCFQFYGGERAMALVDIEHRFNPEWARTLGMEMGRDLLVVQPPNAEAATDVMHELIVTNQVCAIGFDSIGGAAGWREQQTFDEQATMYGGVAGVMARNMKTIAPLANLHNTTCFYANQLRADMQGYNRPMTPGGHAVKHGMSVRIYLRRGKEKYMDKTVDGDVQVGYPMVFKTVKNSYGPAPREQWSDFYYYPSRWLGHVGFDDKKDLQRLGILTGVFQQSSSWYYYHKDQDDEVKGNGREQFFANLEQAGIADLVAKEVMQSLAVGESSMVDLDVDLQRPEVDGPEIDNPDV